MRKTHLFARILAVAAAVAAGQKASADLIVNGDFSAGNTGFTSGYNYDSSQGAGANDGNSGADYYGIVADSTWWHPSFTDFQDHTQDGSAASDPSNTHGNADAGYMMIVNGSLDSGVTVWSESGIAVVPSQEYTFSFWATSAYFASPADLQVTISLNGVNQSFLLTDPAGTWQQFSTTFVASNSPTTISFVDTNTDFTGNDFALDDISLTPTRPANGPIVPLPASALGGSLLLAGLGVIKKIHSRRQA